MTITRNRMNQVPRPRLSCFDDRLEFISSVVSDIGQVQRLPRPKSVLKTDGEVFLEEISNKFVEFYTALWCEHSDSLQLQSERFVRSKSEVVSVLQGCEKAVVTCDEPCSSPCRPSEDDFASQLSAVGSSVPSNSSSNFLDDACRRFCEEQVAPETVDHPDPRRASPLSPAPFEVSGQASPVPELSPDVLQVTIGPTEAAISISVPNVQTRDRLVIGQATSVRLPGGRNQAISPTGIQTSTSPSPYPQHPNPISSTPPARTNDVVPETQSPPPPESNSPLPLDAPSPLPAPPQVTVVVDTSHPRRVIVGSALPTAQGSVLPLGPTLPPSARNRRTPSAPVPHAPPAPSKSSPPDLRQVFISFPANEDIGTLRHFISKRLKLRFKLDYTSSQPEGPGGFSLLGVPAQSIPTIREKVTRVPGSKVLLVSDQTGKFPAPSSLEFTNYCRTMTELSRFRTISPKTIVEEAAARIQKTMSRIQSSHYFQSLPTQERKQLAQHVQSHWEKLHSWQRESSLATSSPISQAGTPPSAPPPSSSQLRSSVSSAACEDDE